MEKFVAFNLYGRNAHGACVTRVLPDGEEKHVYLASDVHALLKKIRDEIVSSGGLRNEFQDFNEALAVIDSVLMEPGAGR